MLNIQDKLYVSIKIDGQEIQYGGLVNLIGTEGNGALIPALKLVISDPSGIFSSSNALSDGNTIELVVSKSITDNQIRARKYRVFSPGKTNDPYSAPNTIIAVLDSPEFVNKAVSEAYSGSSEDTIRKVAAACKLTMTGPSDIDGRKTNDAQVWGNTCTNRVKFLKEIVEHGYIDQHSGMSVAVTSFGEIRYRDLVSLINTKSDRDWETSHG